jgi:hypothetical protein
MSAESTRRRARQASAAAAYRAHQELEVKNALKFPEAGMSITPIAQNLWGGAMPLPGEDLSRFGEGLRVYVIRSDITAAPTYPAAETVLVPLVDNSKDPVTDPPTVVGVSLTELRDIAMDVWVRAVNQKLPTVVVCEWGFDASMLIAGWALLLTGQDSRAVITMLNRSRGVHPRGGVVLGNPNFRSIITRGGR